MSLPTTKREPLFQNGDEIEVEITSLSFGGGRGVGRVEGVVVFIPFTAPGDVVRARVVEVKKSFLRAELSELLTPSPHRRSAPCPVFGRCGGCTWQHVTYQEQLLQKEKILESSLRSLYPFDHRPIVPSPNEFRYRNRIQVHRSEAGEAVGFFARQSRDIVPIVDCPITEEQVANQISLVKARVGSRFEISRAPDDTISIESGSRSPEANLFSQVNSAQNDNLIRTLLDWASEGEFEEIWDLFCGAGNLTIPLKQRFPNALVTGVELSRHSIARAQKLSTEIRWHAIDVASFLQKEKSVQNRLVVLDPPRDGVDADALDLLGARAPKVILYVSCNPMTLARDIRALARFGYRLQRMQGFDMFPQTDHIESLSLLGR